MLREAHARRIFYGVKFMYGIDFAWKIAEVDMSVDKLALMARRRVKPHDPLLWHLAHPEHPSRRDAKVRAQARRELSEARAMRAMLMFEDPSTFGADFMADAMRFSGWDVEELRKDFIEIEEANEGEIFVEGSPSFLQDMIEWAKVVDFDRLCRARDAFIGTGCAHMMLVWCSGIVESAHRFLAKLRESGGGRFFAEVLYVPGRPEQMVAGSLQTSMDEDYLEAMEHYGRDLAPRLLPFMVETHARAVLSVGGDSIAKMGRGIFDLAVHARVNHDDENWHSAELRGTLLELLAAMKGCGQDVADPYKVISKLFADLDE